MNTTIAISEQTREKLAMIKVKFGASSYDEVVSKLADKEARIPRSMFGKAKGMLRYERDHKDREDRY